MWLFKVKVVIEGYVLRDRVRERVGIFVDNFKDYYSMWYYFKYILV